MLTRRGPLAALLLVLAVLASGCWDRHEIDRHGFVLGVAIDVPDPAAPALEQYGAIAGAPRYRLTFGLPILAKLKSGGSGGGSGDSSGSRHFIFTAEGQSMFAIVRGTDARFNRALFFEDMQVLILSEAIARQGIGDIMDFWLRDPEMRRRCKLFVTLGKAADVLTTNVKSTEFNSLYLSEITMTSNKAPYYGTKQDLGEVSRALHSGRGFLLPLIEVWQDDMRLSGSAVFKRGVMVGTLNETETIGTKLLRDNLKQGVTPVPCPDHPDELAVFELFEHDIHIAPRLEGDRLWFTLDAKLAGSLGENMCAGHNAADTAFLHRIEAAVAQTLTSDVVAAYAKQQQLQVDASDLGDLVYRRYPHYWEQVKDRWDDEVFPTVPLEVNIQVTIRHSAMTN